MVTEQERYLLGCPSMSDQPYCSVCGAAGAIERHHVVLRSHTRNRKDKGPTVILCKRCHHKQHSMHPMQWEYDDGWIADGKRCVTREVEPA